MYIFICVYILVRLHFGFGSFVTLCDDVISAVVAGYGKQLDFGVYLVLKHQLSFCGVWRGTFTSLMENRVVSCFHDTLLSCMAC